MPNPLMQGVVLCEREGNEKDRSRRRIKIAIRTQAIHVLWIMEHVLRFDLDHISPVNLVLGERLLPELLQNHLTAEEVVAEALPLLQSQQARQTMLEGYGRLRQALGEPGVTRRAAAAILDALPSRSEIGRAHV